MLENYFSSCQKTLETPSDNGTNFLNMVFIPSSHRYSKGHVSILSLGIAISKVPMNINSISAIMGVKLLCKTLVYVCPPRYLRYQWDECSDERRHENK